MLFAGESTGLRLQSPVLGYIFDNEAKAIRTVAGVPGAASLGDTISLGSTLTAAHVHSGARVAVALSKERQLVLASWGSVSRVTMLETSLSALTLAAFNPSGGRVAVSDGTLLEIWSTGDAPALLNHFRPNAEITAVALNDAGVAIVATGDGLLVRFTSDDPQQIASGGSWSALTFAANGADVVSAEATRNELVRITPDGGRSVIAALPGAVGALASAQDGDSFAAALESGLLLISATGTVTSVACDCQPKGLDRLAGGLVVSVRGTTLVLDGDNGEPRLTALPNLFAVSVGGANQ